MLGDHWLPLCMHVPILELQNILRKSSQHSERSIIPLALLELPQCVSWNSPPRNADGGMGAYHVGVGAYLSPNLARTWENGKNYNHIEKFVIRIPKQGLFQDSDSGGVGWINGGVTKNLFQPITSIGGMGSTGSCIRNMRKNIYMAWQSKSHTPFWAFPYLSEDRRSRRDGIPPWEARWNTL